MGGALEPGTLLNPDLFGGGGSGVVLVMVVVVALAIVPY